MKSASTDYCILVLSFFGVLRSENCVVHEDSAKLRWFEENSPFMLKCLWDQILYHEHANYTLNWYMNGNKMLLTAHPSSRILQQENRLWFIPAIAQDSGLYECIIWNSTRCYKYSVQTAVLSNSAALCFNDEYHNKQEVPPTAPFKIVCHQMNNIGQEVDYSSIHWYKECEPIRGERFEFFRGALIIKDVKKDDQGKYVCKGTYTFRGNKYNFSSSILVKLLEDSERKRTEILYPRNNTVEAELGSNFFTECNVSSFKDTFISISWRVNNTLVDNLFQGRIQEGIQRSIPKESTEIFIVSLNITELKNEDYDQPFICHAGEVAAYIKIQRPIKNFTALVVLILLLIIPVVICILFKIEIVLWYRKSCLPFLHKKVSDGKIYDAYVLYPKISTQVDFVLKVLPDILEKQCGYSLFIPGRDDLPGKALVSVVDETIKQSRRLIMILGPGLSSSEGAPEQNIAVYHALIPDGMKTILIEMNKIKDYSHMPESIRYIKQKQGAVRWKGDITKKHSSSANSSFWKKVRYRMPPEHQVSQGLPLMPLPCSTSQMIET
ncbi:interleukin-1 receptor-like 2 [Candoia aspera]|uniref:interleukin-1 receptor-like 2 n=1 Tax=Candoia aspera TaxID=51853 RepID=UPI002FD8137D